MLRSGTVVDIPLDSSQPDEDKSYLIQFDDSTTVSVPASDMPLLIVKPPAVDETEQNTLLPPFLQIGKKITYDHDGQYHKGYLNRKDRVYRFSFRRHPLSKHEEWGSPSWVSPTHGPICVWTAHFPRATTRLPSFAARRTRSQTL